MPGRVLIYGGTGGIGAATARLLRMRGHSLHLVARNESRLAALAEELGAGFTSPLTKWLFRPGDGQNPS
jgi:short-subunit dehydrogenase